MKGIPEDLSRARYGVPHIPTMIGTVVQTCPLLRATHTSITITATILSSLTSHSTPTNQRTTVTGLARLPLRRVTLLHLSTNRPSHLPALPLPPLLLLERMVMSKGPYITTSHRERVKLVLATMLVKEATVVMPVVVVT